jgi:hypothetical protein
MNENFKEIPIPVRKADYVDKCLRLLAVPHKGYVGQPDLKGMVVYIQKRMNATETLNSSNDISGWGSVRVLRVSWRCRHCAAYHQCYIPESWLAEGKAIFVERVTE